MKHLMTVVAAALTFAAWAQDPATPGRRHSFQPNGMNPIVRAALNPKIAEKIGITEEQQAKLKALADDKDGTKVLHDKVLQGTQRQAELMKAEKIDEAAVMAALDEVFEARKAIAKQQMHRLIAVKTILTPEQVKAATEAIKAQRGSKRAEGDEGAPRRARRGRRAQQGSAPETAPEGDKPAK